MIVGVTGGRHDGTEWPPAGGKIDVPDWEADDLIAGNLAVAVGDEPQAHSGETVPASVPGGYEGTGRAAKGEASAEEVMTGHPADQSAEVRAAADQHGERGPEPGEETARVSGARARRDDPRPDTQILAEDYTPAEAEKIGLGKAEITDEGGKPAKARRKEREAAARETARLRAGARNSALRYAAEGGVAGAPGAEVPPLAEGDEPYVHGPGARPASQVEAEEAAGARDAEGRDITEPGLEGLDPDERAAFESRLPGYTAPEEVRDEPSPGQPSLEPVPGAGPGTGQVKSADSGSSGRPEEAGEKAEGRHRVTAESDSPIEVSEEPGGEAEPAPSAVKQEWVDYAVRAHGADVHEASAMTKADLMSRYGGRL